MKDLLFEKVYPIPDMLIWMNYFREKRADGERKVFYSSELYREDTDYSQYEGVLGLFCTKCGEFHEVPENYFRDSSSRDVSICSCSKPVKERLNFKVNGDTRYVSDLFYRMNSAFPHRLTITEKGSNIHVNATVKNWYFNAKAAKPYSRRFSVRIIINTETGQAYYTAPKKNGKAVFPSDDYIRNATLSHAIEVEGIDTLFFKTDPETMSALNNALARHTSCSGGSRDLADAISRLYLGEALYKSFPEEIQNTGIRAYRTLRKRMKKDPRTFPAYLYWGCSEVSTKSIRKILYKYPEQKWTLHLLYKVMGITNIDILRSIISDRNHFAKRVALDLKFSKYGFYDQNDKNDLLSLLSLCRSSGMTDKEKVDFFLAEPDSIQLRDAARLQAVYNLPIEEIKKCRTVRGLHDRLVECNFRKHNPEVWNRYDKAIEYPDHINALEGPFGNAVFSVIRRPFDLDALAEKGRAHNCVWSYKEDVVKRCSIIIEMTIAGKTRACIELDGKGRNCRQALAPCNQALTGETEELVKAWAEKNRIAMASGGGHPRGARYHVYGFDPFVPMPPEQPYGGLPPWAIEDNAELPF